MCNQEKQILDKITNLHVNDVREVPLLIPTIYNNTDEIINKMNSL